MGVACDQVQAQLFGFSDQRVAWQRPADRADYGIGLGIFGIGLFQVFGRETGMWENGNGFAKFVVEAANHDFSAGSDRCFVDLGTAANLPFGGEHAGLDIGAHDRVDTVEQGLSMPTVLTNVNELIAKGLIVENGEYASTGGRKAKSIGINKEYCRAMGLVITANHLEMVLVNLGYEIEHLKRVRLKFSPDIDYSVKIAGQVQQFLKECKTEKDILGIGIAIPGIIDQNEKTVLKSHALQVENYSLRFLEQALGFPVYFENDANSAMLAEDTQKYNNAIYLSLNHTLGGAFCIDGKLFRGQNQKAGEFGHMILIPGGDRCYCGKQGCADAYCAASVLTGDGKNSLEVFMEQLKQGNKEAEQKWERYLDHLAILISNLRMAYDMDIILGGDVGGVLTEYMIPLGQRVLSYNGFDRDISYLKNCSYEKEASAVGAAKHFLYEYVKECCS